MDTYRQLSEVAPLKGSILTIGTFDGLHLGHQEVIGKTCRLARDKNVPAVVITFDPHPRRVLAPDDDSPVQLILSLADKLEQLGELGVDVTLVVEFNRQISLLSAQNFLEDYVIAPFHPSTIVVGHDNRFGHNREGDAHFLQKLGPEFHYSVVEVTEVSSPAEEVISSSRIRRLISAGQCEEVGAALGRPYAVKATVVKGDGRGREIGFPTANLTPVEPDQLLPQGGVFVAWAELDGDVHYGMVNIGSRPTFGGGNIVMEIHLFTSGLKDLYGRTLKVAFLHRLRDEKKFESVNALVDQLGQDRKKSLEWINENHEGEIVHALVV
ncbi:MAG: riboflavin biosynthesis protein RibF [Candidatus Marinimicrobia bacterium]|nr:riboflavin biosynthesis protein RibF [Candidatus Neomarinimicrobiota bacterium]